jgi:hypothetical protein
MTEMRACGLLHGESGEKGEREKHTAKKGRPKYRKHPQAVTESRQRR